VLNDRGRRNLLGCGADPPPGMVPVGSLPCPDLQHACRTYWRERHGGARLQRAVGGGGSHSVQHLLTHRRSQDGVSGDVDQQDSGPATSEHALGDQPIDQ
jgi:hypothetical protein